MAFKLNAADHKVLDKHLNAMLDAYKSGKLTRSQARASLAHLITAGVIDNKPEFKAYMALKPDEIFK